MAREARALSTAIETRSAAVAAVIAVEPEEYTRPTLVRDSTEPSSLALGVKRAIDIVGAFVGLALAAPVIAILAVLIRIDSPGPVIFPHARLGRGGRTFRCLKLRTMCVDAERRLDEDVRLRSVYEAHAFKLPSAVDPRLTSLGRFLRRSSLDELPQMWNVLRGEMSLVGPRPIVERELMHYGDDRTQVLSMRPGLTGAWAVGGRSRVGYPQRAALELEYVRQWSLWADLKIIARTVIVVLQRRGAY